MSVLNAWVVPGTPKSSWLKQSAGADYFLAAIRRWTLSLRPALARWRARWAGWFLPWPERRPLLAGWPEWLRRLWPEGTARGLELRRRASSGAGVCTRPIGAVCFSRRLLGRMAPFLSGRRWSRRKKPRARSLSPMVFLLGWSAG